MSDAGWYLIVADERGHGFVQPPVLARLSAGWEVLTCSMDERNLSSTASGWKHGGEVWSVTYKGEDTPGEVVVEGTPPNPSPQSVRRSPHEHKPTTPVTCCSIRYLKSLLRWSSRSWATGRTSRALPSREDSCSSRLWTRPSCSACSAADQTRLGAEALIGKLTVLTSDEDCGGDDSSRRVPTQLRRPPRDGHQPGRIAQHDQAVQPSVPRARTERAAARQHGDCMDQGHCNAHPHEVGGESNRPHGHAPGLVMSKTSAEKDAAMGRLSMNIARPNYESCRESSGLPASW